MRACPTSSAPEDGICTRPSAAGRPPRRWLRSRPTPPPSASSSSPSHRPRRWPSGCWHRSRPAESRWWSAFWACRRWRCRPMPPWRRPWPRRRSRPWAGPWMPGSTWRPLPRGTRRGTVTCAACSAAARSARRRNWCSGTRGCPWPPTCRCRAPSPLPPRRAPALPTCCWTWAPTSIPRAAPTP